MVEPIPFGNYYLLERVNVGGMAEIFKAKSFGVEGFSRILAVKRILPNMAEDEEFINMFVDEAKISVQLNHANIVQIYELGCFENSYYIAMEYVPGRDLRQLLDRYRKAKALMPLAQAAYITAKICDGLDYAHRKTDATGKPLNIIHRDVSPQNVMISYEGAVKVLDFGIAKAEDRASKTQAGVLKGKFGYMSPEQVRGLPIDHRSDIFAVGVIFYEMVTGKRLFVGESDFSTLEKVRNAEVVPPSQINPDISPELERVIMKALAKERDERYQWASDFSEDLQQFLIMDGTVFTAKKMSNTLKETYAEDIEAEAAKLEEYAKIVDPPPDASKEIRASHGHKSDDDDDDEDMGAQKTVIFGANEMDAILKGEDPMAAPKAPAPTRNNTQRPQKSGSYNANNNYRQQRQPEPAPMDLSNMPTGVISAPMMNQLTGTGMQQPQMMGGYNSGQFYPNTTAGFQYPPLQQQNQNRGIIAIICCGAGMLLLLIFALFYFLMFDGKQEYASLNIETIPADVSVAVYIDDFKVSDHTPYSKKDLPEGEHTIVLRAEGYQDATFKATAVAGVPLTLTHRLALNTNAKPAQQLNSAPAQTGNQPTATAPQQDTAPNQQPTAETQPQAAPVYGELAITSTPDGAAVYIDKVSQGVTPVSIKQLAAGSKIKIQVSKEGYNRAEKDVTIPAEGGILDVNFELTVKAAAKQPAKKPHQSAAKSAGKPKAAASSGTATLKVHTPKAAGTKIFVNGKDTGKVVPQMNLQVPAGKITITLVNGAKKKTYTLNLSNGATDKIIDKDF